MKTIIGALVLVGVMWGSYQFAMNSSTINYDRVESTVEVIEVEKEEVISLVEQARIELEAANKKLDEEEARLKAEHDAAKAEWEATEEAFKKDIEEIKNLRVSFTPAPKRAN